MNMIKTLILSDKQAKDENNKKLKLFVVLNKYEATTQKFLWDILKAALKRKLIALRTYIKKSARPGHGVTYL